MITRQSFSFLCGIQCASLYCGNFLHTIHPHCGHFKKLIQCVSCNRFSLSQLPLFTFALSPVLIFAPLFFLASFNFPSFLLLSIFLISITNVPSTPKCFTVNLLQRTAHHQIFCLVFMLSVHIYSRMEAQQWFYT